MNEKRFEYTPYGFNVFEIDINENDFFDFN